MLEANRPRPHTCDHSRLARAVLALTVALAAGGALADEPAGWLGDGDGVFPDQHPPMTWNVADGRNILWKTRLPNWSNSSPVVAGSNVFLLAEPLDYSPILLCVNAETGQLRWQTPLDAVEALPAERQADARKLAKEMWAWNRRMTHLWNEMFAFHQEHRDQFEGMDPKEPVRQQWEAYLARVKELGAQFKGFRSGAGGYQTRFDLPRRGQVDQKIRKLNDLGLGWSHWEYHGTWDGVGYPTPVTDGRRVWTVTAHNLYSCHDASGKLLWQKRFPPASQDELSDAQRKVRSDRRGKVRFPWGWPGPGHFSTSPLLVEGKLVSQAGAWVRCMEADTGKLLWKYPLRGAIGQNMSVPRVMELGGRKVIVPSVGENRVGPPGDDVLRLSDGKVLGQVPGTTSAKTSCTGPMIVDGDVVVHYAGDWRDRDVIATRLGLSADGESLTTEELWRITKNTIRNFSLWRAVVHDGKLYHADVILDARTGKVFRDRLPSSRRRYTWRSGMIVGNAFLSINHQEGEFLFRDLATHKVVGQASLPVNPPGGAPDNLKIDNERGLKWSVLSAAAPYPYKDRLYIRSYDYLWCIGKGEKD